MVVVSPLPPFLIIAAVAFLLTFLLSPCRHLPPLDDLPSPDLLSPSFSPPLSYCHLIAYCGYDIYYVAYCAINAHCHHVTRRIMHIKCFGFNTLRHDGVTKLAT